MKACRTLFALLLVAAPVWAQPATLRVTAQPGDALIFVDRELRGQGSADVQGLTPGGHLLRVSGGEDWETDTRSLQLEAGSNTALEIALKPGGAKLLRAGRRALDNKDYKGAIANFHRASAARPVVAAWWEGIANWKAGNEAAALGCFRTYAQYKPLVPELNWILGQLHEANGDYARAYTAYKTAALTQDDLAFTLKTVPAATETNIRQLQSSDEPGDRMRLSQMLMLKGRFKEAVAAVKLALGPQAIAWSTTDWGAWEPPQPTPPPIQVAPPEVQTP